MVGVALLGTNLTKNLIKSLKIYKRLIIILDNDAKQKAMSMLRGLDMPSTMRITKSDLKLLSLQEIERLIHENT